MSEPKLDLYPPRAREENVALIRAVIYARSDEEFDSARERFAEHLHPSLIAELDSLEDAQPRTRKHVDGLFRENWPALVASRAADFDAPDAALAKEVYEARDVFENEAEREQIEAIIGKQRMQRVDALLGQLEGSPPPTPAPPAALMDALSRSEDREHVVAAINTAIRNSVLRALDRPLVRDRVKAWLRDQGEAHLRVGARDLGTEAGAAQVGEQLQTLAAEAERHRLLDILAVTQASLSALARRPLVDRQSFEGRDSLRHRPLRALLDAIRQRSHRLARPDLPDAGDAR